MTVIKKKNHGYPYDASLAVRTLRAKDPGLAALMDRVGPYNLGLRDNKTPFQALLQSVVYQQLSGKSAAAIHNRVLGLFPHRYASPKRMHMLSDSRLLGAGLSRAKVKAANDLAARCMDGTVPHTRQLKNMTDDEVVECLQQIHGIGVWTAQMLLIFHLGRPDVLPAGDLGVLKGFRMTYGLKQNPEPKRMLQHGERWRPYRTVATWYLWRANYLRETTD